MVSLTRFSDNDAYNLRTTFIKLNERSERLTPERFLKCSGTELREIDCNKQKTPHGHELSKAILNGEQDSGELDSLSEIAVRSKLMKVKGIGSWTADIYHVDGIVAPGYLTSRLSCIGKSSSAESQKFTGKAYLGKTF